MFSALRFRRPAVPSGLVLAVLACLFGCRGQTTAPGEVSGKVTFAGKPVAEGLITFQNADTGATADGRLNPDGTYALSAPLPPGEYKVTVFPVIERRQVDGRGPVVGEPKAAPDVPEKYRTVGTTDLKATVTEGKNEHNFDMKR